MQIIARCSVDALPIFLQAKQSGFCGEASAGHDQMSCRCPVDDQLVPLWKKRSSGASAGHLQGISRTSGDGLQMPGKCPADSFPIDLGIAWPAPLACKLYHVHN